MVSDLITFCPFVQIVTGVLILVLMEYGLGLHSYDAKGAKDAIVLILVLMEYGLGQPKP